LRFLESLIIRCLEESGIKGDRVEGLTGVWAGRSKIAALGIAVRNWITFHGLSINVKNSDLSNFSLIRPCGMDIMVTSMETVSGKVIPIEKIQRDLVNLFKTSCGI
jgi:lipoyl(octanoyl) transferase